MKAWRTDDDTSVFGKPLRIYCGGSAEMSGVVVRVPGFFKRWHWSSVDGKRSGYCITKAEAISQVLGFDVMEGLYHP